MMSLTYLINVLPLYNTAEEASEMTGSVQTKSQQLQAKNGQTELEPFIGSYEDAPSFIKVCGDNKHIIHGHRVNFTTPSRIIRSMFMLHNETVNFYSHCIPAVVIILFLLTAFYTAGSLTVREQIKNYQDVLRVTIDEHLGDSTKGSLCLKKEQFTRSCLNNYRMFSNKIGEASDQVQLTIFNQTQGIEHHIKQSIRMKIESIKSIKDTLQNHLAPHLVSKFHQKIDATWIRKVQSLAQRLKEQVDSSAFAYLQLQQSPNSQNVSRWPIVFFLGTAVLALLFSAIFHLFYPMNQWIYTAVSRFDYTGITLLAMGSVISPQYYGFYCQPDLAAIYIFCSMVISVICCVILLFEWIHKTGHQGYKSSLYFVFITAISVPTFHLWFNALVNTEGEDKFSILSSIPYYLLSAGSMIFGLYLYTARCPQRHYPGRFNICGASHQLMHFLVLVSIVLTYLGALDNFQMRKASPCPVTISPYS